MRKVNLNFKPPNPQARLIAACDWQPTAAVHRTAAVVYSAINTRRRPGSSGPGTTHRRQRLVEDGDGVEDKRDGKAGGGEQVGCQHHGHNPGLPVVAGIVAAAHIPAQRDGTEWDSLDLGATCHHHGHDPRLPVVAGIVAAAHT